MNGNSAKGGPKDVLIFCGSGSTAAILKMASVLELNKWPADKPKPVVFVGPYEHHSNLLPWREAGALVIQIPEDINGKIDINDLEEKLKKFSSHPLKIGSFSAASNVTGIITDVNSITVLLHKYGALSFWDYSAAG